MVTEMSCFAYGARRAGAADRIAYRGRIDDRYTKRGGASRTIGRADLELAVDIYLPNTVAALPDDLRGRSAHPGGRNRLFLDGHVDYLRDKRTPRF